MTYLTEAEATAALIDERFTPSKVQAMIAAAKANGMSVNGDIMVTFDPPDSPGAPFKVLTNFGQPKDDTATDNDYKPESLT